MEIPSKPGLTRRDRSLLDCARRNCYLEIIRAPRPDLLRAHGFWCWKLRVPFLYRRSTHLPGAPITPYDGVWRNVPESELARLIAAIEEAVPLRKSA